MIARDVLYDLYWNQLLSQRQIAQQTGIPQATLSRWLNRYGIADPNRRAEQRGPNNHNYKGGTSRSTIRRRTKEQCEFSGVSLTKCQRCKTNFDYNLNRHHSDRDRSNNEITNIEIICPACHAREHDKDRKRASDGRYL